VSRAPCRRRVDGSLLPPVPVADMLPSLIGAPLLTLLVPAILGR
jgi:hypothetical protein